MSDVRLRELERRWQETGDLEDCAAVVAARIRAGVIPRYGVTAAFLLGNECAQIALGGPFKGPDIPISWPWGFVVSNDWIGPWPDCCNEVVYDRKEGVLVVRRATRMPERGFPPPAIGAMLDVLRRLGPEYHLAFAAEAVEFAGKLPGWRVRANWIVNAALDHAEQLTVEKEGGMDPMVHRRLIERGNALLETAQEIHAAGGGPVHPMAEMNEALGALALATSSGPVEDVLQNAINAMAAAANAQLVFHWEEIYWRDEPGLVARTPWQQWERTDLILLRMFHYLRDRLSPWLLGFERGPLGE